MPLNTELPAQPDLYNYRYVFTGRKRGALGLPTVRVEVTFQAPQYQADDAAWQALLKSGAYERSEHFTPIVKERVSLAKAGK